MDEDKFNMEVRKFLKVVGVTSQRAIEQAVRDAIGNGTLHGTEALRAKVTLEVAEAKLTHEIEGRIELA